MKELPIEPPIEYIPRKWDDYWEFRRDELRDEELDKDIDNDE